MPIKSPIVEIAKKVCPAVITVVVSKNLPKVEEFLNFPFGQANKGKKFHEHTEPVVQVPCSWPASEGLQGRKPGLAAGFVFMKLNEIRSTLELKK